jgi:S-adenosylmethionine synthetase
MTKEIFTSESVMPGHPDKLSDLISDTILDEYLKVDENAKVAVETMVTPNNIILGGEVGSKYILSPKYLAEVIQNLIKKSGYNHQGFSIQNLNISSHIHEQSPDISVGVEKNEGAGDQGLMFGYACNDNEDFMPMPISLAHKIMQNLDEKIKSGALQGLGPDGKCQVSVEYENGKPVKADNIVLSIMHNERIPSAALSEILFPIVKESLPEGFMCDKEKLLINPTGRFIIGGPMADCGLTGRKIIVDTYGGAVPHGGGAFSGKDPSKVDRSAAYMARYIAKNIVAAKLADRCLINISYAIGISEPVSFKINTFETGKISDEKLAEKLAEVFKLKPQEIIEALKLKNPIYSTTSNFGHFGRKAEDDLFTWEKLDKIKEIKSAIK